MKRSTKAITMALVGLLSSTSVLAQDTYIESTAKAVYTPIALMKSKISTTNSNDDAVSSYPLVLAAFSSVFPAATNSQWTVSKDNCWVSFLHDGKKSRASFTLKGKMNYVISDCSMEQLPAAFGSAIKKDYPSYRLFNAIEIKAHGAIAYQVVLENTQNFLTLKYTSEGVEKIQQVIKTTN